MPKITDEKRLKELNQAIEHWQQLAREERRLMDYEKSRGRYVRDFEIRIKSYDSAAASLRKELETGEVHCACHLLPILKCRERAQRK